MVVQNINTDLDMANEAHGTIVDIVLHPEEQSISKNSSVVELKHLPLYILVKLDCTCVSKLKGLDKQAVPTTSPAYICP